MQLRKLLCMACYESRCINDGNYVSYADNHVPGLFRKYTCEKCHAKFELVLMLELIDQIDWEHAINFWANHDAGRCPSTKLIWWNKSNSEFEIVKGDINV